MSVYIKLCTSEQVYQLPSLLVPWFGGQSIIFEIDYLLCYLKKMKTNMLEGKNSVKTHVQNVLLMSISIGKSSKVSVG